MESLKALAAENQLELSSLDFALFMDEQDALKHFRTKFHIPSAQDIQVAELKEGDEQPPTLLGAH
jgi:hypothetical protein